MGAFLKMIPTVGDSFARSSSLEFHRSICLERGAQPAVGGELAVTNTTNTILGFLKWQVSDWVWFPSLRATWTLAGETRADFYNVSVISLNSAVSLATQKSAGYDAALATNRFVLTGWSETSRTDNQLVLERTLSDGVQARQWVLTILIQGNALSIFQFVDGFWGACSAAAAPESPPLSATPMLFAINQKVTDQFSILETSRGRQQFVNQDFIDSQIALSSMQLDTGTGHSGAAFIADFLDVGQFAPARMVLSWKRHVIHFAERGEIQVGSIDFPFGNAPFALDCARGFTADYEQAIPPVMNSGRLGQLPIATLDGSATTRIERRIIPPNPSSVLLTC